MFHKVELKELIAMQNGSEKIIGDDSPDALFQVVVRVPGGWIWRITCERGFTATFVPEPMQKFMHMDEDGKVTIVDPHDMEGK